MKGQWGFSLSPLPSPLLSCTCSPRVVCGGGLRGSLCAPRFGRGSHPPPFARAYRSLLLLPSSHTTPLHATSHIKKIGCFFLFLSCAPLVSSGACVCCGCVYIGLCALCVCFLALSHTTSPTAPSVIHLRAQQQTKK
jgi:hypothetical protein